MALVLKGPATQTPNLKNVVVRIGKTEKWDQYEIPRSAVHTSKTLRARVTEWERKELGPAVISVKWFGDNVFPHYHHWLQHRKVITISEFPNRGPAEYDHLIKCYCFGAHIEDETYQDMVVSAIIDRLVRSNALNRRYFLGLFQPKFVNDLYANTAPDSPLRRLIVYALTCIAEEKDWIALGKKSGFPSDFLLQMGIAKGKEMAKPTMTQAGSTPRLKELGTDDTRLVRFSDPKTTLTFSKEIAEETECNYHHHVKTGGRCWRKLEEFNRE